MADKLELVMNRAYRGLKEEMHLERNLSLVKTYLLEAHTSNDSDRGQLISLIQTSFVEARGRRQRISASLQETDDESLFTVSGTARHGPFTFYLDTSDRRFWIAHTISKSETSDSTIDAILNGNSQLDSMWMPMQLLQRVLTLGSSRGLGLDFDRRYLDTPAARKNRSVVAPGEAEPNRRELAPISSEHHLDYVKMQLWGTGAERILDALRAAHLSHSTTISKVRLKTEDLEDKDQFTLADVRFDGKITGRGTSFAIYNGLLQSVLHHYSRAVRDTEAKFRLGWQSEKGKAPRATGQPFYVRLGEHGVLNLEHFCAKLFSGSEPFRLMGLPVRQNENFYTASAIDLHVNQRVDFEVSRSTISVFLPEAACGNTLLRLYTNLQHYFSSDVKATDASGAEVFGFQS